MIAERKRRSQPKTQTASELTPKIAAPQHRRRPASWLVDSGRNDTRIWIAFFMAEGGHATKPIARLNKSTWRMPTSRNNWVTASLRAENTVRAPSLAEFCGNVIPKVAGENQAQSLKKSRSFVRCVSSLRRGHGLRQRGLG